VNTYTGLTTVNSGATLTVAGSGALAATGSGLNANGTVVFNQLNQTLAALNGNGTGILRLSNVSGTALTVNGGTFAGSIQNGVGATGRLIVDNGTFTLSGTNNTYTGGTTVNSSGILLVTGSLAGGTALLDNGAVTFSQNQVISTLNGTNPTSSLTLTGATLTVNAGGAYAGVVTGTGALSVTSGILTLNGINDYTGGTTVGGTGTLNIGFGGSLATSGVGLTDNRTVVFNQPTQALPALNGTNSAATLTLNGTALNVSGGGSFAGAASGTGSLTVSGGSLILSGTNTYTGGTFVSDGTLNLGASGALPANRAVTVNGGTLNIATFSPTTGAVILSDGTISGSTGTLTGTSYGLQNGSISAKLAGTGVILTKTTPGIVTLSGANTFTGGVVLTDGTLNINNATAVGTGPLTVTGGTLDSTAGSVTLTNNNAQNWNGDFTFTGTNDLNLGTGNVTLNANRQVTIGGSGGILTVGGAISGNTFGLTKAGTGTLSLAAVNTYSGGTTVSGGLLNVTGSLLAGSDLTVGALGAANFVNADQTLGAVANANTAASSLNFSANSGTVTLASLTGLGDTNFASNATITGQFSSGAATINGVGTFGTVASGILNLNGATASIGTLDGGTIHLATTALTVDSGNTSGAISGANGSLTKATAGTLFLSGANTYGGGTNLQGGTLNFTNGSLGTAGAVTFGGGTLQYGSGNTQDLSARVANIGTGITAVFDTNGNDVSFATGLAGAATGAVTKTGNGMLTLAGTNTYGGQTTVNDGTLRIGDGSNGSLSTTSASIASGAMLEYDTAILTNSSLNGLNGAGELKVTQGTVNVSGSANGFTGTATVAGLLNLQTSLTGITAVTVSPSGTLSGGDVTVGDSALSTIAVGAGGTLQANGNGPFSVTNATFSSTGLLNVANVTSISGAAILNFVGNNGLIANGGNGSLSFVVGGTNSFANSASYDLATYTGMLANTGVFSISNANVAGLGARQSATLDFATSGQIKLAITGNFPIWSGAESSEWSTNVIPGAKNWELSDNSGATDFLTTDQVLFDDSAISTVVDISVAAVLPSTVTFSNSTLDYTLQGMYGIGGTATLLKQGTKTLTIDNANSYTGGTTINAGTVVVGNTMALGSTTGALTLGGGMLDLNGNNISVGSLSGNAGTITTNSGPATLTVQVGTSASVYGGLLNDGTSGQLGLTLTGTTGSLSLTNAGNNYAGLTTLNGGTLNFVSGSLGASNVTFGGGTLQFATGNTQDVSTHIKNSTSASIRIDTNGNDVTFAGVVDSSNTAGLTKLGSGRLTLAANNNTFTGDLNVGGGTLQIGNHNTGSVASTSATIAAGATLAYDTAVATTSSLTALTGAGGLTLTQGTLSVTGSNSGYTGTTTLNGGTLDFTSGALGTTGDITFGGGTLQYASGNTENVAARIKNSGGAINIDTNGNAVTFGTALASSNTGGLTKSGPGSLILTAANAYSGPTTISGGTLQIGSGAGGGTTGTLPAGSAISGTGTLTVNRSNAITISNALSGGFTLNQIGNGTTTINGANSGYNGTVNLNAGTVNFTNNALGTTSTLTFAGGTLQYAAANTQDVGAQIMNSTGAVRIDIGGSQTVTFNGAIDASNTAGLTKSGTGNLRLSGSNGYTGLTTVSGGTLQVIGSGTLASTTASLGVGTTLNFNSTATNTLTSIVATGGTLTVTQGMLNLSGTNNAQAFATNLNGGTLNFTANSLGAGLVTFGGGTLQYASGNTQDVSNQFAVIASGATAVVDTNGNDVTYSNGISGNATGAFTKTGSGTLILAAANGYGGLTTVADGTLQIGNGTGSLTSTTASLSSGGTLLINTAAATTTTLTSVTGAGTLVSNQGKLTLSGANTGFTGTVTVNSAGTLNINNNSALGASAAALTINGGTIDNTSGGSITVANGSSQNWNGDFTFTGSNALNLGTGSVTLTGNRQITTTTNTLTVGGVISGGFGLIKAGAGTLALNGANLYTGSTTINAGTVTLGSTTALGPATSAAVNISVGTLSLNGNSITLSDLSGTGGTVNNNTATPVTLTVNKTSGSSTFSGTLVNGSTGTLALTKSGDGTLILGNSANSYTGATTVQGGTLLSNTNNVLPTTSPIFVTAAGTTATLDLNGFNNTVASLTLGGTTTSSVPVVQTGAGTLTLGGNVAYDATNNPAGGAINGKLDLGASTRTFTVGDSTTVVADLTVGAVISGAVGITKAGAGTLVLTNANTYTGLTTVSVGALNIRNATALGTDAAGTTVTGGAALQIQGGIAVGNEALTLNGTGVADDGALRNVMDANSFAGAITLDSASRINSDAGTLTLTGGITTSAANTLTIGGAGDVTVSTTAISGGGTLTKDGAGTLILAGTHTYTGATSITAGTLQLDGSLAALSTVGVGTSGTLTGTGTVNGNATLTGNGVIDFGSAGNIVGTLGVTGGNWNGTGSVTGLVTASSGTFTIGAAGNLTATAGLNVTGGSLVAASSSSKLTGSLNYTSSANSTFQGVIDGAGSSVTMNNAMATLSLTGANTYGGATNITAGTLQISNDYNLGSGDLNFSGTGTLDVLSSMELTNNVNGVGVINLTDDAYTLTLSGSVDATLTQTGDGHLIIFGGNAGTTNVQGGQYTVSNPTNAGDINLSNNANLDFAFTDPTADYYGNITVAPFSASTISVGANKELSIYGDLRKVDSKLTFAGSGSYVIYGKIISPSPVNAFDSDVTFSANTLLMNQNTYMGPTFIDSNAVVSLGTANALSPSTTLELGTGGTFGVLDLNGNNQTLTRLTASGFLGNEVRGTSGTLTINNTSADPYSGVLTGGISLTKQGVGTLTLTGANTHTGGTTISAGTLEIGDGGTTGSLTGNVTNSSNLVFNRLDSSTFGGVVSGLGTVEKTGAGTLTLTNLNLYSGATTISGGTLQAGVAGAFSASSAISLADASGVGLDLNNFNNTIASLAGGGTAGGNVSLGSGTLTVGNATSTTYAGMISGSGGLTKVGTGTLILSGASTYSGVTSVSNGILSVGAASNLGNGSATNDVVLNGGTLQTTGNIILGTARNLDVGNSGGTINIDNGTTLTVAGTMNTTGALTKSGGGTLDLTDTSSLNGSGASATLTIDGGVVTNNGSVNVERITNNAAGAVNLAAGSTTTVVTSFDNFGVADLDGTFNGDFDNKVGGMFTQSGTINGTLTNSGIFSPGNSPGLATVTDAVFLPSSTFNFEINDVNGVPGPVLLLQTGWDLLTATNTLNLGSLSNPVDSSNRINLNITSLSGLTAGIAAGFNRQLGYSWEFMRSFNPIHVNGGVSPGNVNQYFNITSTAFQGDGPDYGTFNVTQSGDRLFLNFAPHVPEPSTFVIWSLMGAAALAYRRRKNRNSVALAEADPTKPQVR
jgi:fibronectin-binding autotransporter adhesin